LDPNCLEAHNSYAFLLQALGRLPEAIVEIGRAEERDPLSGAIQSASGRTFYRARRYQEAIRHFQRAIDLDPKDFGAYGRLGDVYEQMGRFEDALAAYDKGDKALALTGSRSRYVLRRVRISALMGKRDEARKGIEEFLRSPAAGNINAQAVALVYVALGDKDRAIAWLQKGVERHDLMSFIKVDPKYDSLQSDPRFKALLRRMNFPE
jgi:tetratricopeptide (TPR) repeat protein